MKRFYILIAVAILLLALITTSVCMAAPKQYLIQLYISFGNGRLLEYQYSGLHNSFNEAVNFGITEACRESGNEENTIISAYVVTEGGVRTRVR